MDKYENKIDDNNTNNFDEIENIINNFHESAEFSMTENEAIKFYDDSNISILKKNQKDNSNISNIIQKNISYTAIELQNIYWNKLIDIINSIKKTSLKYPYPVLEFGKSLDDLQFLQLFEQITQYISYALNSNELKDMIKELKDIIKNSKNIFAYPQILKDVKENGLLTYMLAETKGEKNDSKVFINCDNCTFTPFIKLQFSKNNINQDLDKNEITNIMTSNVLIHFFKNNLKNFIPKFDEKIKDDNDLKNIIISYINKFNIYFCNLPPDYMAFTIHNGNIYMKSKYLKEYYENNMNQIINEENSVIIREKIVLNIQHELNHALLRVIDKEKKNNFFLKSSHINSKNKILKFKDKFNHNIFHEHTIDESGCCFDFLFYKGYYFNDLYPIEANFFLDIKNIKDENEYNIKFNEMMKNNRKPEGGINSINKFKNELDYFPRCVHGIIYREK